MVRQMQLSSNMFGRNPKGGRHQEACRRRQNVQHRRSQPSPCLSPGRSAPEVSAETVHDRGNRLMPNGGIEQLVERGSLGNGSLSSGESMPLSQTSCGTVTQRSRCHRRTRHLGRTCPPRAQRGLKFEAYVRMGRRTPTAPTSRSALRSSSTNPLRWLGPGALG